MIVGLLYSVILNSISTRLALPDHLEQRLFSSSTQYSWARLVILLFSKIMSKHYCVALLSYPKQCFDWWHYLIISSNDYSIFGLITKGTPGWASLLEEERHGEHSSLNEPQCEFHCLDEGPWGEHLLLDEPQGKFHCSRRTSSRALVAHPMSRHCYNNNL